MIVVGALRIFMPSRIASSNPLSGILMIRREKNAFYMVRDIPFFVVS